MQALLQMNSLSGLLMTYEDFWLQKNLKKFIGQTPHWGIIKLMPFCIGSEK